MSQQLIDSDLYQESNYTIPKDDCWFNGENSNADVEMDVFGTPFVSPMSKITHSQHNSDKSSIQFSQLDVFKQPLSIRDTNIQHFKSPGISHEHNQVSLLKSVLPISSPPFKQEPKQKDDALEKVKYLELQMKKMRDDLVKLIERESKRKKVLSDMSPKVVEQETNESTSQSILDADCMQSIESDSFPTPSSKAYSVERPRTKKSFGIIKGLSLPFYDKYVANDIETFQSFSKEWLSQSEFSWSLLYTLPKITSDRISVEEETSIFLPEECTVEGICVCWSEDTVYFLSLVEDEIVSYESRWTLVKDAMMNKKSSKILFNMKPQLKILYGYGIITCGPLHDPRICAWILNTDINKDKTLYQLVQEYTYTKTKYTISSLENCFLKSNRSLILMRKLRDIINNTDRSVFPIESVFLYIEMPLVPILAHMEYMGVGFVNEICQRDRLIVENTLKELEKKAFQIVGRQFSLTSTTEVSEVLFNILNLPPVGQKNQQKAKRQRKQQYSADKAVLHKLTSEHPLPAIILEHRKLSHLITHCVELLNKYAFYDRRFSMHRISSTILQTCVPTGRLASTDPNLQNIPHEVSFTSTDGTEYVISIRDAFVPTEGYIFLSADYSQLELRFLAHLSEDEALLNFLYSGGDVFKQVASHWLDKPAVEVNDEERTRAKHLCYGVIYGGGAAGLAEKTSISKEEAEVLIQSFKRKYPGISKYQEIVSNKCKSCGYVQTLFGRRRYLSEINSSKPTERLRAERQAISSVCQGSAADLVKLAMWKVCVALKQNKHNAILLLQIHDELLFEVKEEEVHQVQKLIKNTMEHVCELKVPLPVNITVGRSWGSMQLYEGVE